MHHNTPSEQWSVIVDTNSYSGNFERELGAFVTGEETIRGQRFVEFIHEAFKLPEDENWEDYDGNPFKGLFQPWPGEHGDELAHIASTPGYGNDGYGNMQKLSDLPKEVQEKYPWPSYQSVQIRCTDKPTPEQLKIFVEWCLKFAKEVSRPKTKKKDTPFEWISPLKILGVRLVREVTTTTEESVPLE